MPGYGGGETKQQRIARRSDARWPNMKGCAKGGGALHGAGEGDIARDRWICLFQCGTRFLRASKRGTHWPWPGAGTAGAAPRGYGPCSHRCFFQGLNYIMPQFKY